MIDWNIQTRARECQECGKAFADQEHYHTLLFDEKTAYTRQDICEACWTRTRQQPGVEDTAYLSHWQGVYESPPPPSELIHRETAETLLRKLVERNDPRYLAAMFILAVMLERKRLLRVKDQVRRDGRRFFVYEHPKTGDVFTIADPELGINQLEQVQRDVSQLLERGLVESAPLPTEAAVETPGCAEGDAPSAESEDHERD